MNTQIFHKCKERYEKYFDMVAIGGLSNTIGYIFREGFPEAAPLVSGSLPNYGDVPLTAGIVCMALNPSKKRDMLKIAGASTALHTLFETMQMIGLEPGGVGTLEDLIAIGLGGLTTAALSLRDMPRTEYAAQEE